MDTTVSAAGARMDERMQDGFPSGAAHGVRRTGIELPGIPAAWTRRLRDVKDFIEDWNRIPGGDAASAGERRLARWLDNQRRAARTGRLAVGQTDALRDLLQGLVPLAPTPLSVAGTESDVDDFVQRHHRMPDLHHGSTPGERRLARRVERRLGAPRAGH
jgi:hypothetical protein